MVAFVRFYFAAGRNRRRQSERRVRVWGSGGKPVGRVARLPRGARAIAPRGREHRVH